MAHRDWYKCRKCGHEWQTRKKRGEPPSCPRCNRKDIYNKSEKERKEKRKRKRQRRRKRRKRRRERRKKWNKQKKKFKEYCRNLIEGTALEPVFKFVFYKETKKNLETIFGIILLGLAAHGFSRVPKTGAGGVFASSLFLIPGIFVEPHLREAIENMLEMDEGFDRVHRIAIYFGLFMTVGLIIGGIAANT